MVAHVFEQSQDLIELLQRTGRDAEGRSAGNEEAQCTLPTNLSVHAVRRPMEETRTAAEKQFDQNTMKRELSAGSHE